MSPQGRKSGGKTSHRGGPGTTDHTTFVPPEAISLFMLIEA